MNDRPSWRSHDRLHGVVGGAVDLDLVFVRTDNSLIYATNFLAFSDGCAFSFELVDRGGGELGDTNELFPPFGRSRPYLSVAHADDESRPALNVTLEGNRSSRRNEYVDLQCHGWLWPLPEPALVRLGVEWPWGSIDAEQTFDATCLVEAAARSRSLWTDDPRDGRR